MVGEAAVVAEALPAGDGDLVRLASGSSVNGDGAGRELVVGAGVDEGVDGAGVDLGPGVARCAHLEDSSEGVQRVGEEL